MTKKKADGEFLFEEYYSDYFGERWPLLREALKLPVTHYSLHTHLQQAYFLDPGSVRAALSLPITPNGTVLDMCAAPGGKTLVLASKLTSESRLVSNEYSRERRQRLLNVLDTHLDPILRSQITVTGYDASRWSRYEKGSFDSILLDAPCSSERHVLSSPQYLSQWTPARIKNLAQRQWALLSGAWLVLKENGYLLYSTCALSPRENDEVAHKLIKKYSDVEVIECNTNEITGYEELPLGEKTTFGRHILPDTNPGAGPIYYVLFRKLVNN